MDLTPSCSLIISTYNWPEALELALLSTFQQSVLPKEIVICDDGSGEATKQVIEKLRPQCPVPLFHIWHPDNGFRKSVIMNKGISITTGDYIIEIDQDIVLHKHFIKDHLRSCKKGVFLSGNRFYIDKNTTEEILETKEFSVPFKPDLSKNTLRMIRNRMLQKIMAAFYHWDKEYEYILGCNMSFWKDDFVKVNGYDESYIGWGWEDTDLALRLMNSGVKLSFIRFGAIQFHLFHKEASRDNQQINHARAMHTIKRKITRCEIGFNQHANSSVKGRQLV